MCFYENIDNNSMENEKSNKVKAFICKIFEHRQTNSYYSKVLGLLIPTNAVKRETYRELQPV